MPRVWLVPVDGDNPLCLGAERIVLEGDLEAFREMFRLVSPRLLPMVKASILPGEPEDESADASGCGAGGELRLDTPGDIRFDGYGLLLSSCGLAFVHHIPSVMEQRRGFTQVKEMNPDLVQPERGWLDLMAEWNSNNRQIMLIKEE